MFLCIGLINSIPTNSILFAPTGSFGEDTRHIKSLRLPTKTALLKSLSTHKSLFTQKNDKTHFAFHVPTLIFTNHHQPSNKNAKTAACSWPRIFASLVTISGPSVGPFWGYLSSHSELCRGLKDQCSSNSEASSRRRVAFRFWVGLV